VVETLALGTHHAFHFVVGWVFGHCHPTPTTRTHFCKHIWRKQGAHPIELLAQERHVLQRTPPPGVGGGGSPRVVGCPRAAVRVHRPFGVFIDVLDLRTPKAFPPCPTNGVLQMGYEWGTNGENFLTRGAQAPAAAFGLRQVTHVIQRYNKQLFFNHFITQKLSTKTR
jgi:hypothetical protein